MRKSILFIFSIPIYLYSLMVSAVYIDGGFKDWRVINPGIPPNVRIMELDVDFRGVYFDGGEEFFRFGKTRCHSEYGCRFYVETVHDGGGTVSVGSSRFLYGPSRDLTVDEINQAVSEVLPLTLTLRYSPKDPPACVNFILHTGFAYSAYVLGSSCTGLLPPVPPVRPRPPEPLSCSITWLSSGEIDFGVMTQGGNKLGSIDARLACQGGTSGRARLRFTDVNRVGANTVTLRKGGSGDEIRAKLSIGDEHSANEQIINVSPGFNAIYSFAAKLDGAQLTNVDGGYFFGNALLMFEVI
ncbi:hypothetical protein PTR15_22835 [Serratia nevei]|uniref:hypothetical protein n=1 Tax=Serratia nevei TaxID=2703794 RepID=UPI00313EE094